jgi:Fe-S-cluster-containing hydrogenase component 2
MQKVLIVDVDQCTGCRACELACSMHKTGKYNPKNANVRVLKNKDMDINMVTHGPWCDCCEECVKACLQQAIQFVEFKEAVIQWKGVKVGRMPAPLQGPQGRYGRVLRQMARIWTKMVVQAKPA